MLSCFMLYSSCDVCPVAIHSRVLPAIAVPKAAAYSMPTIRARSRFRRPVESRIITILLVLAGMLAGAVVVAFSLRVLRGGF